jgi:dTMP kinase
MKKPNMNERGKYIVLEGADGTGKTTQAILLDSFARSLGIDTLHVLDKETGKYGPIQEPGGTPRADALRAIIKDRAIERTPWQNMEWLTEARQSLNEEVIQPSLNAGRSVISGRNWYSTVAYQGYAEGLPIDEIEDYTRQMLGDAYMDPDFAAILYVEDEIRRLQRINGRSISAAKADTFEAMPPSFHSAVHAGYRSFVEERNIPLIDAGGTRIETFQRVLGHTATLLEQITVR